MDLATESGDDNSDMVVDNDNIRACLTYFGELNQYFPVNFEEEKYDDIIESFKNGNIIYTVEMCIRDRVFYGSKRSGDCYSNQPDCFCCLGIGVFIREMCIRDRKRTGLMIFWGLI